MKRTYYLFNPGRMTRKDNTLCFAPQDKDGNLLPPKHLPIETIADLFIFGSVDANSALYNLLGKESIAVHFFDYYEHYTGSFMPKDKLLAGKAQIEQTKAYLDPTKRMHIAKAFIEGATFNMLKNLKYYDARGRDFEPLIQQIETYRKAIDDCNDVPQLMGIEGNCRQVYYAAFDGIINDFTMGNRTKMPPSNEINSLISFGNMMCYSVVLGQIYHTQLNPTISYLHEPGARRYSLALDVAELFKPILVDRAIFKLFNKKEIQEKHFDKNLNSCLLNQSGKQIFAKDWQTRLDETIKHRTLNKSVSYKHLIKLECYKLQKYILGIEPQYKPFKIWW
ncbi:MAG: CRISPR-associated endonuclease Cas1, subtype [Bacteroidota bacterium]|jgi:CRISPR-associated protein Cas1